MKPSDYRQLVSRLERVARENPQALRLRVRGFVALGYGYVFAVLLGLVASFAALVWAIAASGRGGWAVKFLLALLVIAWLIAKSLYVRITPPRGERLTREAAPLLFRRAEAIRAQLKAPRADVVLLSTDFNASVTQVPRLGIFGWQKTYLVVGLPLMYALDQRQFDAVLAHEFAHLSGAHPKLGLWVYRTGRTWEQLLDNLTQARSMASKVFEWFFRWYVPRLHAYGLVMSRRDEFEADADAASVVSGQDLGTALANLEVRGGILDRLWSEIWRRAEHDDEPPERSWSRVPDALAAEEATGLVAAPLARALARTGLDEDTHPPLRARLHALGFDSATDGVPVALVEAASRPVERPAGDVYLGRGGRSVLARLEREWRENVRESWTERGSQLRETRARVAELKARDASEELLGADEIWTLACATGELEGSAAAIPYLRRATAADPQNSDAHFLLGQSLLAADDAAGVEHVERSMSLDAGLVPAGAELLRSFYAHRSDNTAIRAVEEKRHEHWELMNRTAAERNDVTKSDRLVPAELADTDVALLREIVRQDDRVRAVWVARKLTTLAPERPLFVFLVERKWWRPGTDDQKLAEEFVSLVQLSVTADVLVIVANSRVAWLRKRMRAVRGSRISADQEFLPAQVPMAPISSEPVQRSTA